VKAWLVESPSTEYTLEQLKDLGVLYWKLDADKYEEEGTLGNICKERGYTYKDIVTVAPDTLPNYEEKIKIFFQEHLHTDDEIRFFLNGSGYFDVRGPHDEWIRIHCSKGEMIILPAGIYHRYTNDEKNFAKVMRLFQGDPIWTPFNRGKDADEMEVRKKYVNELLKDPKKRKATTNNENPEEKKQKTNAIERIVVPTPSEFDQMLNKYSKKENLFILFTGNKDPRTNKSWCPDCVTAEPIIDAAFQMLDHCTVLECLVEREDYKGKPQHPYRVHPKIKLKAIPTLVHWGKVSARAVLVEDQCCDPSLVNDFIEQIMH